MPRTLTLPTACALALLTAGARGPVRAAEAADGVEFFEQRIRPLLAEHCFRCHGADKRKGNLQMDGRAGLLRGGDSGSAVAPGDPDKSLLIKAVRYTDPALRMPPKGRLPGTAVADLTRWVGMGAPWPTTERAAATAGPANTAGKRRARHWAFEPLRSVAPPAVRAGGWARSPIDRFVLARLEAAGLTPAPPADRRTLIRRLTYDLIGLPPTPAEVEAFVADRRPDAYERLIDRLLAWPHYGERWGRHWLDLVRFAETAGHEFDFDLPEAYAYRDYIVRAFNADLPYDQLVTEHVAGDLMPEARRRRDGADESIAGTGFWFLGEAKHSPVDVRADEMDRMDNQIDVFAKTFLGLTVSCARCHDHKFDPITQQDYYALAGFLESSRCQRAFIDPPGRTRELLRELERVQAEARAVAVAIAADALQRQAGQVARRLLASRSAGDVEAGRWAHAVARAGPADVLGPWAALGGAVTPCSPTEFAARRQALLERMRADLRRADDARQRALVFEDFAKDTYDGWFVTGDAFGPGPAREPEPVLASDPYRPVGGVAGPGGAQSGRVADRLAGALRSRTFVIPRTKILYHVAGRGGRINLIIDNYQLIRNPIYGGLTFPVDGGDRPGWHVQDVSMWVGHRAYVEILDDGPGTVAVDRILFADEGPPGPAPNRLVLGLLADPAVDTPDALARKYEVLCLDVVAQWRDGTLARAADCADRVALLNWMLHSGLFAGDAPPAEAKRLAALRRRHQELEAALPEPHRVLAMADGTGWNEHVLLRGNPHKLGPTAPRRFLGILGGRPSSGPGSGRLELARRLVAPSDPLLPRVLVNRLWQHHFGEGIVRSVDNFGALGELPTHPELLDWLAAEFVRCGWSVKALHRVMLRSSSYQMASRPDAAADRRDPQNKLLHRMPVRRLEAESVRDAILAVSGRLDRRMEGPGVPPYLTEHMVGRGRPTHSGPLDGAGRRSLYINVRRNFLTPMFLAFDYPVPFTTMGRRTVSNVPAQALALMNNPFVVQQARTWARRLLAGPRLRADERVRRMYLEAFGRAPTAAELADAITFLGEQGGSDPASAAAAWADLCHVLFNIKEFIFIE